jgi:putative copper export protein/methionine-rich copper-binding protein CopC
VLLASSGRPAAAAAPLRHVDLIASRPAHGAVLVATPAELMLRFSGRVERAYTSLSLVGPDGAEVLLGDIVFAPGSNREFTAAVPPLRLPGAYAVHWRTAGADGHVLQGVFSFELAGAAGAADAPADAAPGMPPMQEHEHLHTDGREHMGELPPGGVHPHGHEHVEAGGTDAGAVLGRWLHFGALLLLVGALAFRVLLLPRLVLAEVQYREATRRSWGVLAAAALLLTVAALLRLWLQSAAMHGAAEALDLARLSTMLQATAWGRAWAVQVLLLVLLAIAMLLARPGRDRGALLIAAPAVLGLCTIPALTGHAAGVTGVFGPLVVANDALHVAAAGAWFGTLLLVLVVLPGAVRGREDADGLMAGAVERFSPLALGAAVVVVATGVGNSLLHFSAPAQLLETQYGVTLLVKLGVFALVLAAGFYNWRVLRPRLASGAAVQRLRVSAGLELGFAALLLLATAVLTGLPRP